MRPDEVTLGEGARRTSKQLGVPEDAVRRARSGAISSYDGREYLTVVGELPDGRSIRMNCRFDRPNHIVSFRPLG